MLLFWGWSGFFSGRKCIRLATSQPLLLYLSSKMRGDSSRDKVTSVIDKSRRRSFPEAKPPGQGRITGKDLRKPRSTYSFPSTAASDWAYSKKSNNFPYYFILQKLEWSTGSHEPLGFSLDCFRLKVPLRSKFWDPFFYIFLVHNRPFLDMLPNFNLSWTSQCTFFGPLLTRIYRCH